MPKPVTVSVEVPQSREQVFAFIDVLPNHAGYNDHFLRDWEFSGPERGVGAKAQAKASALGMTQTVEIEVIEAQAPERTVERNIAGGRVAQGTYKLDALPNGGTRISFEYRWIETPFAERLTAPLVRSVVRRAVAESLRRLAGQLPSN
ncbi:MAG TPA: SRPBCC family protein [Solirubrobacterales bacterium]|nr:SRPBCC family protein [Solirubrobacterales bacterium]